MRKKINILGQKFGKLKVIENLPGIYWKCLCDCGKDYICAGTSLRKGNTKSCGCIRKPDDIGYLEKCKKRILGNIKKVNGCWEWQKSLNFAGYGVTIFRFKNKHRGVVASRVSFMVFKGEIPKGLHVLHSCDNPKCVNPEHLHLGTPADNVREMRERNRQNYTKKMGEKRANSKLNQKQINFIRKIPRYKDMVKEISEVFNISITSVYRILKRETWSDI